MCVVVGLFLFGLGARYVMGIAGDLLALNVFLMDFVVLVWFMFVDYACLFCSLCVSSFWCCFMGLLVFF